MLVAEENQNEIIQIQGDNSVRSFQSKSSFSVRVANNNADAPGVLEQIAMYRSLKKQNAFAARA